MLLFKNRFNVIIIWSFCYGLGKRILKHLKILHIILAIPKYKELQQLRLPVLLTRALARGARADLGRTIGREKIVNLLFKESDCLTV